MSDASLGPLTRDLHGQSFGRLSVVKYSGKSKWGYALWECLCTCGITKVVVASSLINGLTTSCGCRKREVIGDSRRTHGKSRSKTYMIWSGMRKRCENPNVKCWAHYGGRGIKVCERWGAFENFLADMGECPKGHSIERVNNDGNYEPSNCIWADKRTQSMNKRDSHRITFNGVTKTLTEWGEAIGMNSASLRHRLKKGWPIERALTEPVKARA